MVANVLKTSFTKMRVTVSKRKKETEVNKDEQTEKGEDTSSEQHVHDRRVGLHNYRSIISAFVTDRNTAADSPLRANPVAPCQDEVFLSTKSGVTSSGVLTRRLRVEGQTFFLANSQLNSNRVAFVRNQSLIEIHSLSFPPTHTHLAAVTECRMMRGGLLPANVYHVPN